MGFTFRPARRENTPLIIGLAGPTKSGKTFSAHRIAVGLAQGGPVAMINAEGAKGHQYSDRFTYLAADITAPYRPERYTEVLKTALALEPRPAVVIIDSLSHMHDGPGGVLEYHESELDRLAGDNLQARQRSTWSAWVKPKAAENEFIYEMLSADCHLILCFRAKEKIKVVRGADPIDLGWQPIAGERVAFETIFTLTLPPHSKGVPDLAISQMREPFDTLIPAGQPLSEETGRALAAWAAGAASAAGLASAEQRREIFKKATEARLDEDALKALFVEHTGQEASAQIPAGKVAAILAAIATPVVKQPADVAGETEPTGVGGGQQVEEPEGSTAGGAQLPPAGGTDGAGSSTPDDPELAGTVVVPNGQHAGKTLAQVAALGDGRTWLWWALRQKQFKGEFRDALETFVESAVPDLWEQFIEWKSKQPVSA